MKVIITGGTGFVGSALIEHCITNPAITSAIILTRRPLNNTNIETNPKIKTILHDDFTTYPPSLLQQLKGAQCCLWAIGGRATSFPSVEAMHRAQHDTTLAAARAFAEALAPAMDPNTTTTTTITTAATTDEAKAEAKAKSKFRFVFCSGKFTECDQDASLWFMAESRKSKGFVEKALFEIADEEAHRDVFEVYCVRPGGIIGPGTGALHTLQARLVFGIAVDALAAAMCRIALEGEGACEGHVVENDELCRIGGG